MGVVEVGDVIVGLAGDDAKLVYELGPCDAYVKGGPGGV